jgi:hypothetical protein
MLGDGLLDDLDDDLVGYKTTGGDDAFGLEAKLAFCRQFLAQEVAG